MVCVSPITGLGCLWHCPEKSTPHVHRAGKQTLTYAWLLRSELQEGNGAAPASKRPKQPQEAASAGAECLQAEPVPIKYTWPCYSWDTDRVCAPGKCVPGSASQQTQRDCCPYPDLLRIRHNSHPLQLSNQPSSDVSRGTAVSGGKRWRFLPPWKSWTWCRVLCSSAGNHFCSPLSWQAPLHTNRCPHGMYLGHFYLGFWELGNMFFCLFLGF